jgi:hypothetical protein
MRGSYVLVRVKKRESRSYVNVFILKTAGKPGKTCEIEAETQVYCNILLTSKCSSYSSYSYTSCVLIRNFKNNRRLGERYSSYSFTTSALDGGEWSASRPGRALDPGKGTPVPIVQEAGWAPEPVWTQRLEEKSFRPCRE